MELYEALTLNFDDEGDKIARIKKGEPGADIRHEVCRNGRSNNHAKWRNSFVSKLKKDQLAANADHGILTAAELPSGSRQFVVRVA